MKLEIIPKQLIGYVSHHVAATELHCHCDHDWCRYTLYSPVLLERFELLRSLAGNNLLLITSAYRCTAFNQMVGGVKHSKHLSGLALDLKCPSNIKMSEFNLMGKQLFDVVIPYGTKNFMHCHLNVGGTN